MKMETKSVHIKALLAICLGLPITILSGQTEKLIVPSDLKQQTVVTEPVTLRKGFLRAGIIINYRVADKYFDNDRNKQYYLNSQWGTKAAYNLTLQYGFTDRFEADLVTDYMRNKVSTTSVEIVPGTNSSVTSVTKQLGTGLGDTHLGAKYQIVPEKQYRISLTGLIDVSLPTGEKNPTNIRSATKYDLPVGNGAGAVAGEIFARTTVYPYSFSTYIKYYYNFEGSKKLAATDLAETRFKFGNRIEAGLSAYIHLNEWIVFANDFSFYHEAEGWAGRINSITIPESWAAVYAPDLVFQVRRVRVGESISIPLIGRNVPADPLFIISLQYVF